jgi:ATP phosphoribosyltransferase
VPPFLRLAVQKSGRIGDETLDFLRQCDLSVQASPRGLTARCTSFPLELLFLRSKDIPEIVADGGADLGICGQDVLAERGDGRVRVIEALGFGRCRLSIAAPAPMDLDGARIATSFPNTLGRYLAEHGIEAEVVELSGSVEIAPGLGIADAICDLVSTGSTLAENGLVELSEVMPSETVLFGPMRLAPEKEEMLDRLVLRMRSRRRHPCTAARPQDADAL